MPAFIRQSPRRCRRLLGTSNSSPELMSSRPARLFDTIKSVSKKIVNNPLDLIPFTWLSFYEQSKIARGKRRRVVEDTSVNASDDDLDRKRKRKRVDSPVPPSPPRQQQPTCGYLDVPEGLITDRDPVTSSRSQPPIGLNPYDPYDPRANTPSAQWQPNVQVLRSASSGSLASESVPDDGRVRRSGSGFSVRSALTPQLSSQTFGPALPRRERDASEPPPLGVLVANPSSVKPPPEQARSQSSQPTLGSLQARRGSSVPLGQQSTLQIVRSASTLDAPSPYRDINPAEKVLKSLDLYKTPLLPSRLRATEKAAATFKSETLPVPDVLLTDEDKEHLGLGHFEKVKSREDRPSVNPYAGRSTMKKMLYKRRQEEEEEEEEVDKEKEFSIVDKHKGDDRSRATKSKGRAEEIKPLPRFADSQLSLILERGREQSSLRVGRTSTRNHIPRPIARGKGKFFGYDEDALMEDGVEEELQQVPMAPLSKAPEGFSFANNKAPITHDSTGAAEPPIAALPFSLTPSATPSRANQPQLASAPATLAESAPAASAAAPLMPSAPSFSVNPPTPVPSAPTVPLPSKTTSASTSASTVPNFFANAATFKKTDVGITAPTVPLFGAAAPVSTPEAKMVAPAAVSSAEPSKPVAPLFGAAPVPAFGAATSAPTSLFGLPPKPTAPQVGFGAPSMPAEEPKASATPSGFGASSKPAEEPQPAPSQFVFGASSKPSETSAFGLGASSKPTAPAPLSIFGAAAKPVESPALPFPVSTPKPQEGAPEAKAESAPKPPMFGGSTAAKTSTFGSFGSAAASAPAAAEAPKTRLTFGQTSTPAARLATPTDEQAKPLSSTVPASSAPTPFGFGSTPTTPTTEKTQFTFGGASGSSRGAEALDKPFAFSTGAPATPSRTITPPQIEEAVPMDESPIRGGNAMDINGNASEKPSTGFTFGQSSGASPFPTQSTSTPFGFGAGSSSGAFGAKPEVKLAEVKPQSTFGAFGQQAGSSGFGFGQKPAESTPSPLSQFGATSQFGQAAAPSPSTPTAFTFTATNAFGQQTSSAATNPASPTAFTPTQFAFGATSTSATAPTTAFGFGSQPGSPANASAGLPQPQGATAPFIFGAQQNATPTVPPPAPGGTLFTIGSAPAPSPTAGRPIKRLPNRRLKR